MGRRGSKSTSQIHDTSLPSAVASLSATASRRGGVPASSVRIASFAPAGFLIKSISSVLSPTRMRSKRPKAPANVSSPAAISSSGAWSARASAAAASAL